MRVVECVAPGKLRFTSRPAPEPAPGEVLVRIRRVGVCGTDYHIFKGDQPFVSYPRVMGHELAGEVISAPPESSMRPGEAVCIVPYVACRTCVACRRGKPNCCVNIAVLGVHRDGGLAEHLCAPLANVLPGDGLSLDELAMAEFLAIGRHAVRRANLEPGQRALVVGAGPIGLGVALFAKWSGAQVTVIEQRADRRAFCTSTLGVDNAFAPSDELDGALSALTGGEFFDAVFDATGARAAMEKGFGRVAHGGAYVLVSIVQGDIRFTDTEFHKREMTLLASRNATNRDFLDVLSAMREGRVPIKALNTHRTTLDSLVEAMPAWAEPEAGVIKALVEV